MTTNKQTVIEFIDLFSGTGAFSLAFEENQNFHCVFANDMIPISKTIYELNNKNNIFILGDINQIKTSDIPKHDLLCGGFPCQPFSIAGKQEGFKDKRSNVFWKILEIISEHSPKFVVLENVKNLKSHDDGKTFKTIKSNLKQLGYHIKSKILDTSQITGIPQNRERIYIVCFKDQKLCKKFHFDFEEKPMNPIKNYLEDNVDDKYYYTERYDVYDAIKENVTKSIDDNIIYQYRRYYVRENKSQCCPTLTANMGSGGHNVPLLKDNKGIRKLTPRECFNLQGFPKNYQLPKACDSALYKLAGNAVSVPVVRLIVNKLSELIQV